MHRWRKLRARKVPVCSEVRTREGIILCDTSGKLSAMTTDSWGIQGAGLRSPTTEMQYSRKPLTILRISQDIDHTSTLSAMALCKLSSELFRAL